MKIKWKQAGCLAGCVLGLLLIYQSLSDQPRFLRLADPLDAGLRIFFLGAGDDGMQGGGRQQICFFIALLFSFLFLIVSLMRKDRGFRSLTLLRYGTKAAFVRRYLRAGEVLALVLAAAWAAAVLLCIWLSRGLTGASGESWLHFGVRMANLTLLFLLSVQVHLCLRLRFRDRTAIVCLLVGMAVLLLADSATDGISLFGIGSLPVEWISLAAAALATAATRAILWIRMRRWDFV